MSKLIAVKTQLCGTRTILAHVTFTLSLHDFRTALTLRVISFSHVISNLSLYLQTFLSLFCFLSAIIFLLKLYLQTLFDVLHNFLDFHNFQCFIGLSTFIFKLNTFLKLLKLDLLFVMFSSFHHF